MTARSLRKRNTNPFGVNSSLAFGIQLPKKHQTQKMLERYWYHSNILKSQWLIKYDQISQSKFKVLSVHQAKQSQLFFNHWFYPFDGWSTKCSAKSTKRELARQKSSTANIFTSHLSDKMNWLRNHNFPGIVKQLELNLLLIKSKSLPKLLHKLGIEDITI